MAGVSTGTGFASNVLTEVLKKGVEVVKMTICLPGAVTEMKTQVDSLKSARDEINADLAREQRSARGMVQNWLDRTGTAIGRSDSIRNEYDQHKNCLGCCPNYLWRYRISRHVRDFMLNVGQLKTEIPSGGPYGDPTTRPDGFAQIDFVADAERFEHIKSLETLLTTDNKVRFIALHGMGGVGKTSMLDTIIHSQKVKDAFDNRIIKVTVSKTPNISKMQKVIADGLNLTGFADELNPESRKARLQSYFLENPKFILLLDDIWAEGRALDGAEGPLNICTREDLQYLGVPINDTGFKIVITTRDRDLCTSMHVQQTITVGKLREDEAWRLFCSKAFTDGNVSDPEIEEVARNIAKECQGLPLAIKVVAAAMTRHTDKLNEWKQALYEMQYLPATFDRLHSAVDQQLFKCLRHSYDHLRAKELQTCFLYFAAYPEDTVIDSEELIEMLIAESLVKGHEGREDSYLHDIGHGYINHLRDRCLIEVVHVDFYGRAVSVKIHDVLRDLAIRIAEEPQHGYYFKAGQGVLHFPVNEVESKAAMSLMSNNLSSLPEEEFAGSSLSLLLLRDNKAITKVPEQFLLQLSSMKVLDLSRTSINELPTSIGNLKHLVSLQLEYTRIPSLPDTIGNLKDLQVLNLRGCDRLCNLPETMSKLKCLRVLDVSQCRRMTHLPRGISELVSLERLSLQWSVVLDVEDANAEREYACLKDLQSLHRLRDLSVQLKSPVEEGVMRNWSKMRYLRLSFTDGVNQDYLPQDMREMKDLEKLNLWGCDVERLPSWVSEFPKLASLNLVLCSKLEELELELGMGFPRLQELILLELRSLKSVGALAAASGGGGLGEGVSTLLPMLKFVWVDACPQLKRFGGDWDKLNRLERIDGSKEWWDGVQWDDPNIKMSLENKFRAKPWK